MKNLIITLLLTLGFSSFVNCYPTMNETNYIFIGGQAYLVHNYDVIKLQDGNYCSLAMVANSSNAYIFIRKFDENNIPHFEELYDPNDINVGATFFPNSIVETINGDFIVVGVCSWDVPNSLGMANPATFTLDAAGQFIQGNIALGLEVTSSLGNGFNSALNPVNSVVRELNNTADENYLFTTIGGHIYDSMGTNNHNWTWTNVSKIDNSGNFIWSQKFSNSNPPNVVGMRDYPTSIAPVWNGFQFDYVISGVREIYNVFPPIGERFPFYLEITDLGASGAINNYNYYDTDFNCIRNMSKYSPSIGRTISVFDFTTAHPNSSVSINMVTPGANIVGSEEFGYSSTAGEPNYQFYLSDLETSNNPDGFVFSAYGAGNGNTHSLLIGKEYSAFTNTLYAKKYNQSSQNSQSRIVHRDDSENILAINHASSIYDPNPGQRIIHTDNAGDACGSSDIYEIHVTPNYQDINLQYEINEANYYDNFVLTPVGFGIQNSDCYNVPDEHAYRGETLLDTQKESIEIYPTLLNIETDHFYINSTHTKNYSNVEMFSTSGRKVYSLNLDIAPGKTLINIPKLSSGIYMVIINSDNRRLLKEKIVIQ